MPVLQADRLSVSLTEKETLSFGMEILKPNITEKRKKRLLDLVYRFSDKIKIPESEKIDGKKINKKAYLLAQIWVESNFKKYARSRSNAQGLMQLKPATARILAPRFNIPLREAYYNDEENVQLGVAHLNSMISRFGSLEKAAYAYNIGSLPFSRGRKNDFYWKRIKEAYKALNIKLHY